VAIVVIALWFGLGGYDRFVAHNDRWPLTNGDTVEILTNSNEYGFTVGLQGRTEASHYLLIQFRSTLRDPAHDKRDVRGIMEVICRVADSVGFRRINIQPTRASLFDFLKYSLNHWVTVDSGGHCTLDEDQ
jgi:hypothetical protein